MDKVKKLKLARIASLVLGIAFMFIPFAKSNDELVYTSIFGAYKLCLNGISPMFFISLIFLLGYISLIVFGVLSFLEKNVISKKVYFLLNLFLIQFIYLVVRNMVYASGVYILLLIIVLAYYVALIIFNYYVLNKTEK